MLTWYQRYHPFPLISFSFLMDDSQPPTTTPPPHSPSISTSDLRDSAIDASHELFLHHSDHPNYSISSKPLDEDNYNHWRRAVEVSLMAKNKLGIVKGTCKSPDPSSPQHALWERCNNTMISWLLHSISSDIAES